MTVTIARIPQVSLRVESLTVTNRVAVNVNNIILAATQAKVHRSGNIQSGLFKTTYTNLHFTGTDSQMRLLRSEFSKLNIRI